MKSFTKLSHDFRKQIIRDYMCGISIDDICTMYNLTFDTVYSTIYYKRNEDKELIKKVIQRKIDDDRIIIMGDTHLGGLYENYNYIEMIYNYAKEHGIKTILHAGDLIDGYIDDYRYTNIKNPIDQAEEFTCFYPEDDSIKNYMIFGNHDLTAVYQSLDVLDILKERKDFDYLAVKKAYIMWENIIIGLKHDIDYYKVLYPYKIEEVNFSGHLHRFDHVDATEERPEKVYIPACLNTYGTRNQDYLPGFLNCFLNGNEMNIECIHFNDNKIEGTYKVLQKKCEPNPEFMKR